MFCINPRTRRSFLVRPTWQGGGGSVLDTDPNYAKSTIRLPFEGANASTTILDAMGNSWSASGNAQLTTSSPLDGSSSLLLDGSGDYCSATRSNAIGTADFTICAKIKPASLASDGEIFCISSVADDLNQFNIVFEYKTTGAIRFSIQTGSGGGVNADISSSTGVIASGTAYDVEACADGSTARIYVGGAQVASGAITGTRANGQPALRIGFLSNQLGGAVTRYFNGRVDNVLVYAGICLHPGGTTFTPPATVPMMPIPRFTSRFTVSGSANDAQGVTTDGTHVWFSSSSTVYKYTTAGSLVTSRNVLGDSPIGKTQINGLAIKDNVLRVSGAEFFGNIATSWIADYNPDSLAYIGHRQLIGDRFAEGMTWHKDSWWVCFHAHKVVARYTDTWKLAAVYPLTFTITGTSGGYGGTQGYDGLFWKDSYLWLSIHEIYDQDYWDVYHFYNGTMYQVARILRNTAGIHQGICLDPIDSTKVWAAERVTGGGDDAVVLLTIS